MIQINPTYDQVYYIVDKFQLLKGWTCSSSIENYVNLDSDYMYTCTRSPQGHTVTHISTPLADAIKQDKLISHLIK